MVKRWSKYFGAILALVLVSGVFLLIFMVGANFLQLFLVTVYKDIGWTTMQSVQASFTIRSFMNFYYVIFGVLFLGFFILMEHRLITTGVPRKLVLRRTLFTLGLELMILALFHLATMLLQPAASLQVGLTAIEALLGIGLIYIARRKAAIFSKSKEAK